MVPLYELGVDTFLPRIYLMRGAGTRQAKGPNPLTKTHQRLEVSDLVR